jgi:glutamyl-tRNA synthetase
MIVTRFPPSPTGFMHIGTGRTALFNWLYARKHGGKMLFRIEDTDRARHSDAAVQAIVNGMNWLGLDWDGEIVSQYARQDRHAEVAHELLKAGKAYYCYCSPEELEDMRAEAIKAGRPTMYDRRWRDKGPQDAPDGIKPVIRIKAPLTGKSVVHDVVQGDVEMDNAQLDDFVLLRSDGTPTYMLAVVVDDHDMGVTHVVRGDDHLNNAFRQNIIMDQMGWTIPVYAHMPMILGPDGAKMSKRHGATSVEDYQDMGYLPEAMVNYLMRLGWSHGDDEIFSIEQALEWFDIKDIHKSPARFDFDKLDYINAHYIKAADPERLVSLVVELWKTKLGLEPDPVAVNRLHGLMPELQTRAKTLLQMAQESAFLAKSIPYSLDEKATEILQPDTLPILRAVNDAFANITTFDAPTVEAACKDVANAHAGGKLGKVGMPLRAALTGTGVSPTIFTAAAVLGQDECVSRLNDILARLA